jgi:Bacterial Ig-like domain (group 3)
MFTILFGPKATGTRNGTLTIVTNAPGPQTLVVNLSGNGVLTPQANLAPSNLTFGPQTINTPSTVQKATLQNIGNGVLNISGVAINGPFSQSNNCGSSLAAGGSCTFSITFTPTAAGPSGGTLSFNSNAAGGYFAVGLNGTGAAGAAPTLTPASLTFAAQAVGTVSPAQTVVLSNPGTTPFTFGGIQATENYKASTTCSGAIAPGASCNISVQFAPTNDTYQGGFPVYGGVYVTTGTKGSPLMIQTNGTANPSTGATPNLAIASSVNPSTVGQSVVFTATVTSASNGAVPTGTVTFFDTSASIGTGSLTNGVFKLTTSTLSQGTHDIFYSYGGDANYSPQVSPEVQQTVNASSKATTTTTVTSAPNPAASGQSVKFTASVTSTTSGTITGTVQFYDGSTAIGSPVTLSGGGAAYSTTTLSAGSHSITAVYSGDSTYGTSTSSALTQTINAGSKASTTTAVTSSANPSTVGANVTFSAAVTSSTSGTLTGTVQFYDGATALGSPVVLAAGAAQYSTTALGAGAHAITATYSGDTNYATSTSPALTQTVNSATKAATTTAVQSSLNPSTVGASVTFTAMVMTSQAGTITGTVQFYDGATALGSPVALVSASASAALSTTTLAQGANTITATYSGDANYVTSTSPAITQTVNASTNGDFGVSVIPSSLTVPAGQAGSFNVAVAPVNGSTQTVALTCSGLPANASCSFASNAVTLDGKDTATVMSAIVTSGSGTTGPFGGPSSHDPAPLPAWESFAALVAAMSSLLLIRTSRNRAWRLALAMVLLMLPALAITACSGAGGGSRTPKGMYTVTVTGTSGTITHTAQLSVTVD